MTDTPVDKTDLGKVFSPDAAVVHHAEDITADREPYGPPGLRGLVSNPFVLIVLLVPRWVVLSLVMTKVWSRSSW